MRLQQKSTIFAPMEGYTDPVFRRTIAENFPHWDFLSTDFFRVPSEGEIKLKHLEKHYGYDFLHDEGLRNKTIFQILSSKNKKLESAIKIIEKAKLPWLDLNLGCPSKKVTGHGGGSFLLSAPQDLKEMLKIIRQNYSGFFSVKMRIGFKDADNFEEVLQILEDENVNAVTIHPRLKTDLYKGKANLDYIQKAVQMLSIPVIGNGDILSVECVQNMYEKTSCHSVMVGRGAIENPLLAKNLKGFDEDFNPLVLILSLKKNLSLEDSLILKRFKSLSVYIFRKEPSLLSELLRTQSLAQFEKILNENLENK